MKKVYNIIMRPPVVVLAVCLLISASWDADTLQVLNPGDTLIAKKSSIIMSQPQFQRVVSDKQQLKTDSIIVSQDSILLYNARIKDSIIAVTDILEDSISNKYRALYVASATHEAKLESTPWYDSKLIWFLLGFIGSLFIAEEVNYLK